MVNGVYKQAYNWGAHPVDELAARDYPFVPETVKHWNSIIDD